MNFSKALTRKLIVPGFLLSLGYTIASPLQAFDLDHLASKVQAYQDAHIAPQLIDLSGWVMFDYDMEALAQGHVQYGWQMLDADKFKASPFRQWDVDHFGSRLGKNDQVLVVQTALMLSGRTPDFYNLEQLTRQDFLDAAFCESKNYRDSSDPTLVHTRSTFLGKGLQTDVHFQTYHVLSGRRENMSEELGNFFLSLAPRQQRPEMITSTYSTAADVSEGSHGGRTINYYYRVNDRDSLHISYKLVTFKKEKLYFDFLWSTFKRKVPDNYRAGTWRSLQNIRNYQG